jgi:hypothetical protein
VLARYDPFRSDSHNRQHRPTQSSRFQKPPSCPTRPETHQNQIYNTKEQTKHGTRQSGTDPNSLTHENDTKLRGFAPETPPKDSRPLET